MQELFSEKTRHQGNEETDPEQSGNGKSGESDNRYFPETRRDIGLDNERGAYEEGG